jgi:hypothetical protein
VRPTEGVHTGLPTHRRAEREKLERCRLHGALIYLNGRGIRVIRFERFFDKDGKTPSGREADEVESTSAGGHVSTIESKSKGVRSFQANTGDGYIAIKSHRTRNVDRRVRSCEEAISGADRNEKRRWQWEIERVGKHRDGLILPTESVIFANASDTRRAERVNSIARYRIFHASPLDAFLYGYLRPALQFRHQQLRSSEAVAWHCDAARHA